MSLNKLLLNYMYEENKNLEGEVIIYYSYVLPKNFEQDDPPYYPENAERRANNYIRKFFIGEINGNNPFKSGRFLDMEAFNTLVPLYYQIASKGIKERRELFNYIISYFPQVVELLEKVAYKIRKEREINEIKKLMGYKIRY